MSSVLRGDGVLDKDDASQRFEALACRMSRLVSIASLLHKYIILEMFHALPAPHRSQRQRQRAHDKLTDLVGVPMADGQLFLACLLYFSGNRKIPSTQSHQTRAVNELVYRYGPRFLRGQPYDIGFDDQPVSTLTLRSEARVWHANVLNLVQERCWERLMRLINGLTGYAQALRDRKALSGDRKKEAASLVESVRSYKNLLNERRLFDDATGRTSAEATNLLKDPAVKRMDDVVRPLVRQYIMTAHEVSQQLKAKDQDEAKSKQNKKDLNVRSTIGRFPGRHFVLLLAVHTEFDRDTDRFPQGLQCVPIRRSLIPGCFEVNTATMTTDVLHLSGVESQGLEKLEIWNGVFNLDRGAFRPAGDKRFRHSIHTDGVSVAVHKSDLDTGGPGHGTRGEAARRKAAQHVTNEQEVSYIQDLPADFVLLKKGHAVFVDVGQINLGVFVHERYRTASDDGTQPSSSLDRAWKYSRTERDFNKGKKIHDDRRKQLRERAGCAENVQLDAYDDFVSDGDANSALLEDFNIYIDAYLNFGKTTHEFYENRTFRYLRMEAFSMELAEVDRVAHELRARFGQDALIVFGDRAAQSTVTDKNLYRPSGRPGKTKSYPPRGLVECRSEQCVPAGYEVRYFDRDVNASVNMRNVWRAVVNARENGQEPVRPDYLCPPVPESSE
ncbi:hypothetical protein OC844_007178 [Tilletia horrida]|nr:hypothetical protein OC844_007178 [Tilletia horrida]